MSSPNSSVVVAATVPYAPRSPSERELDATLESVVRQEGQKGTALEALWRAAISVDPEIASTVDGRARLASSLDRMVAAGIIRPLPRRRQSQDRTALPPLPLVVRVVRPPKRPKAELPELPAILCPELARARDLVRPRSDEVATLCQVNDFLRDLDTGRPSIPLRERSLEIFGDEKRLDVLAGQRLFSEGILSYELLRCYVVHPPFVYHRISDAPVALVLENHHTYDSALRVLREDSRGFGVVIYGAGRAFCASVTYLADLEPAADIAYYFGDLDATGLSIAAAADAAGRGAGTGPVVPAAGLYGALLASRHQRPERRIDETVAKGLVS